MTVDLTRYELNTVVRALAVHYLKLFHSKSKKIRPSEKAMELADIIQLHDKLKVVRDATETGGPGK